MSIKNLLRKAAELVVELPPEVEAAPAFVPMAEPAEPVSAPTPAPSPRIEAPVQPKSVAQIIHDQPGPNLDEIQIPAGTQQMTSPTGDVDFIAVYNRAGLAPTPFSAEQAHDVINSLPAELPIEAKRATVNATLKAMGKAMGVSTEGVIADAGRKVAALSAYEDMLSHQTEMYVLTLEAKIADLENLVAGHKAEIEKTRGLLTQAIGQCEAESERLDDVLEFFTLDKGASKNA